MFCRSIQKAQQASLPFTPVYAALVALVNSKFPHIGELLLSRLIVQFRKAYKRNDKTVCIACIKFIAHLINQRCVHELLAFQLLTLLLERPTDDSIEVAVSFMRDTGSLLTDLSTKITNDLFERFRAILNEGAIDKRTQFMVEVLFQVRRDKFAANPPIAEGLLCRFILGLDLVDENEQVTHYLSFDDDYDPQNMLNVYKFDENFEAEEEKYAKIKQELFESDSEDEDEDESESESEEEVVNDSTLQIMDRTNTATVILRRAIYLTIMSSLNFEECCHKLMKLSIKESDQMELCNMIIECCSQERSYIKFYGLIGERYAKFSTLWATHFQLCFEETFKTIHRFETSRLRNIGKYFSHLLATDAISWNVFCLVKLTEEDTTSSSRIFLKILFQELNEVLGLQQLKQRLHDPNAVITLQDPESGASVVRGAFDGLFPRDSPKNARFAINYFTSIGLGGVTEELREWLKEAGKGGAVAPEASDDSSDDSSDESSDSDDLNDGSKSPSRSSIESPRRRRNEGGSAARRHASPAEKSRRDHDSPPRREESRSDDRRREPEPTPRYRRHDSSSRSPVQRRHESPAERNRRRDSALRSPVQRRGVSPSERRRRNSSVSRSPLQRRRDSPPQRSRNDSASRSPEQRRRQSFSPRRRRTYRESRSPVQRRNESPLPGRRESPRDKADSPSPIRESRRSESPVERSRARRANDSPKRGRYRGRADSDSDGDKQRYQKRRRD